MSTLNSAFAAAKAREIEYEGQRVRLYDVLDLPERCKILVTFEESHSEWLQGVWLGTMQKSAQVQLSTAGVTAPGFRLWQHNSPRLVEIDVAAPNRKLWLYNIWDKGNGAVFSQLGNCGMLVETLEEGRKWRYRCNDNHLEVTFAHLVFTLEILPP